MEKLCYIFVMYTINKHITERFFDIFNYFWYLRTKDHMVMSHKHTQMILANFGDFCYRVTIVIHNKYYDRNVPHLGYL